MDLLDGCWYCKTAEHKDNEVRFRILHKLYWTMDVGRTFRNRVKHAASNKMFRSAGNQEGGGKVVYMEEYSPPPLMITTPVALLQQNLRRVWCTVAASCLDANQDRGRRLNLRCDMWTAAALIWAWPAAASSNWRRPAAVSNWDDRHERDGRILARCEAELRIVGLGSPWIWWWRHERCATKDNFLIYLINAIDLLGFPWL
jgi:hypothetical protein